MPAYIALGSNLGDSVANIKRAFMELEHYSASSIQKSSLWRSMPVDCPEGSPDFFNAVAAIEPLENEMPESLLTKLQQLEIQFGRRPKLVLNEPRPLDLDLIAFKTETRNSDQLTLPHPRWHERRFVLDPLNEIAAEIVLPRQSKSVSELLSEMETDEILTRL